MNPNLACGRSWAKAKKTLRRGDRRRRRRRRRNRRVAAARRKIEQRLEDAAPAGQIQPTLTAPGAPFYVPVHRVTVHSDGSFSPAALTIYDGDIVQWELSDPTDSIIPTAGGGIWPAICDLQRPYEATDQNEFTGPMPDAPSGIFALGPVGRTSTYAVSHNGICPFGATPVATADSTTDVLCKDPRAPFPIMAETWQNPNITGVFIRALWNNLNPAAGEFNLAPLMAEIDKAVANGKFYSLGIKAGHYGTPSWIFDDPDITELSLHPQEYGSTSCGISSSYANPTSVRYWQLYRAMLSKVIDGIMERNDRFRALAYFKPSGANEITHENKLPRYCHPGCCNNRKLANDGYTPAGLFAFYDNQLDFLAERLPGKALAYALIQDGFPQISNAGAYLDELGAPSGPKSVIPGPFTQTEIILDQGQALLSDLFVVQHLGLRPQPKPFTCPNYGIHPVPLLPLHGTGSYADAGSGCPNKWVLRAGADGQITGFQTVATVTTGPALESSLQSMWDNSDAATLELYEHTIWKVENNNGGVLNTGAYSTGRTIGQWRDELDTRRPQPLVHRHRFSYEPGATLVCLDSSVAGPGTTVVRPCNVHNYIHGSKCAGNDQATGTIIVLPRP